MVNRVQKSHHVSIAPTVLVMRSHIFLPVCARASSVEELVLLLVAGLELLAELFPSHLSGSVLGGQDGEDVVGRRFWEGWTFGLRGLYGSLLRVDLHEDHQAQDEQPPFGRAFLGRWEIFAHLWWVHDPGVPLARAHRSCALWEGLMRLRDALEGEDLRFCVAGHHRSEIKVLLLKEVVCRDWEHQTVWSGEHSFRFRSVARYSASRSPSDFCDFSLRFIYICL